MIDFNDSKVAGMVGKYREAHAETQKLSRQIAEKVAPRQAEQDPEYVGFGEHLKEIREQLRRVKQIQGRKRFSIATHEEKIAARRQEIAELEERVAALDDWAEKLEARRQARRDRIAKKVLRELDERDS